ncbi:MAG: NAD(P)/FAD-dependent oxidoreductase [Pyrinomonadaceae bacterium]
MANEKSRVAIIGGGFGGLFTALELADECAVTLISRADYFQFTPMLYEYLSGEAKAWQIAPPYKELLGEEVHFVQGEATNVDLQTREITIKENAGRVAYDVLVMAVGGVTNYENVEGAKEYALPFRTIEQADELRRRMSETIDRMTHADDNAADDAAIFAIVGGSASGIELATKMADLLQADCARKNLTIEPRVMLIEEADEIAAEMDEELRAYALRALENARIEIQTKTKVLRVDASSVTVERDGAQTEIKTAAVVWTGGVQVNPLVLKLKLEKEAKKNLIVVENTLQTRGHENIFALGDIAHYENADKGLNGTAQLAYQQASLAADNIKALFAGKELRTDFFKERGTALSLGTTDAAVEIGGEVLTGRLAREARFAAYAARLPTWRHRLTAGAQWLLGGSNPQPLDEPR